jgi:hypothetical protein
VKSRMPAQRIFQSVAAGLLGDASFQGGWSTAALGVAVHFVISITIAAVGRAQDMSPAMRRGVRLSTSEVSR